MENNQESTRDYTRESPEMTQRRMQAMVDCLYRLNKEADITGECDYERLEAFVNSVIYSALVLEKDVKAKAVNSHNPNIPEGTERFMAKKLIRNNKMYNQHLRNVVTDEESLNTLRKSFHLIDLNKPKGKGTRNRIVNQYDMKGNLICSYETLKEATFAMGIKCTACITNVIKGMKNNYKGYIFRYGDEE